jgi:hypothetical protein
VAGLILRLRHSPEVTRRRTTQDASETGCTSDSRVCVESRFLPLQGGLHAMCQRGAGENGPIVAATARRESKGKFRASRAPSAY